MRIALGAAVVITVLCGGPAHGRAQAQSPAKETTAAISGRVTVSGKPAVGIVVIAAREQRDAEVLQAFLGGRPLFEKATTDEAGRFRISNLAAGSYSVQPLAPALIASGESAAKQGLTVVVADGETATGINFALIRGGVITGRVTHADGRAAVQEHVSVSPVNTTQGTWRGEYSLIPNDFQTDDRGVYRVYGLPAGRYIVSVGGSDRLAQITTVGKRPARPMTYHPGTTDRSRATVVDVALGGEKINVDIRLGQATRTYKATGRVVDAETGKPIASLLTGHTRAMRERSDPTGEPSDSISMEPSTGADAGVGSMTNANGEFHLDGLTPGRHMAFAVQGLGGDSELYGDPVQFEIKYEDVGGLEIKMHRGSSVSGVVTVEGTSDPNVLAKLSQIQLFAGAERENAAIPNFSSAKVAPNGEFVLRGLRPGKVRISLFEFLTQQDFSLIRVEHDGVDAGRAITIAAGEHVTGLRVVVGYPSGIIRGHVKLEGDLPKGAHIIVIARRTEAGDADDDDDDYSGFLGGARSTVADSSGGFTLDKLMPGEYRVTATVFQKARTDTPLAMARENVTVAGTGESAITIVLDVRPKSNDR